MKNKLTFILVILVAFASFTSCEKEDDNPFTHENFFIEGTYVQSQNNDIIYIFNSDGTGTLYGNYGPVSITYEYSINKLFDVYIENNTIDYYTYEMNDTKTLFHNPNSIYIKQ